MKRIILLLLAAIVSTGVWAAQPHWTESLVNMLLEDQAIDKSVAVNRDTTTHEITNATYDFRFKSNKIYDMVKYNLLRHTAESEYFSESGGKNNIIVLRTSHKGRRWSFKLEKLGKNGDQFLVRVSSGTPTESTRTETVSQRTKRKHATSRPQRETVTNPATADKKAEIEAVDEELRREAAERKRRLGL